MIAQHVGPPRVCRTLIVGIVRGDYRWYSTFAERRNESGVPIVEMNDVGLGLVGERSHGGREREEPSVVIPPRPTTGRFVVGVWTFERRCSHQRELFPELRTNSPDGCRSGPLRYSDEPRFGLFLMLAAAIGHRPSGDGINRLAHPWRDLRADIDRSSSEVGMSASR